MLITTRSCLLHPSRNPVPKSKNRQRSNESALRGFGIRRVVWLDGDRWSRVIGLPSSVFSDEGVGEDGELSHDGGQRHFPAALRRS
jgi:hypothetical protein